MKKIIKKILIKMDVLEQFSYFLKRITYIFISDKSHFQKLYLKKFNREIDFQNPKTLNEKVINRTLFERNKIYTDLADKYKVRTYVKNKIEEEYLIDLYGVYEKVEDIDFDALPNEFVLKCTHDSGSVFICSNKNDFDISYAKKKLRFYLKRNYYYLTREWHYKNIKPRIICEEKLSDTTDYKFHCFNGKVELVEVISDRFGDKRENLYDKNWNFLNVEISGCKNTDESIAKPKNYEKMLEIAEKLSSEFDYVRIDFYNIDGKIKFGEMTFTPAGGVDELPYELDRYLGQLWK